MGESSDLDRKRGHQDSAIFLYSDVRHAKECRRAVEETIQTFGRLDILVNNAGVFFATTVLDCTEEIARAALFLASDDSSFMTGAIVAVDGGGTA